MLAVIINMQQKQHKMTKASGPAKLAKKGTENDSVFNSNTSALRRTDRSVRQLGFIASHGSVCVSRGPQ